MTQKERRQGEKSLFHRLHEQGSRRGFGKGLHVEREYGHPLKTADHGTKAAGHFVQFVETPVKMGEVAAATELKGLVSTVLVGASIFALHQFAHIPDQFFVGGEIATGIIGGLGTQIKTVYNVIKVGLHGIHEAFQGVEEVGISLDSALKTHEWAGDEIRKGIEAIKQAPDKVKEIAVPSSH